MVISSDQVIMLPVLSLECISNEIAHRFITFFCAKLLNSYYDLYSLSRNTSILYFEF